LYSSSLPFRYSRGKERKKKKRKRRVGGKLFFYSISASHDFIASHLIEKEKKRKRRGEEHTGTRR